MKNKQARPTFFFSLFRYLVLGAVLLGCVDPEEILLGQNVNVVVVDGTINNLPEPQVVYLNRSKSDPITGRFGTLPLSDVPMNILVDSSQVVALRETAPGRYQASDSFRGQVGHSYQLRFTLPDGTKYESSAEVMQAVPPIASLSERFNTTSLPPGRIPRARPANDFFVDWQDPAEQHNYYRWDWKLWEKQDWCRTCTLGFYFMNSPYDSKRLFEDCLSLPYYSTRYYVNDYPCRSECWEIVRNSDLNLFDDQFTNGRGVQARRVAQIPFFQSRGSLVEIRQSSLTQEAYRFYKLVQDQTQNNGGLADTPPTATIGNVQNVANRREAVVGYFNVSAIATVRYWLDRQANTGAPSGLFFGLTGLQPSPPGIPRDPNTDEIKPVPPPNSGSSAVCVPSDSRTPVKPEGWRD